MRNQKTIIIVFLLSVNLNAFCQSKTKYQNEIDKINVEFFRSFNINESLIQLALKSGKWELIRNSDDWNRKVKMYDKESVLIRYYSWVQRLSDAGKLKTKEDIDREKIEKLKKEDLKNKERFEKQNVEDRFREDEEEIERIKKREEEELENEKKLFQEKKREEIYLFEKKYFILISSLDSLFAEKKYNEYSVEYKNLELHIDNKALSTNRIKLTLPINKVVMLVDSLILCLNKKKDSFENLSNSNYLIDNKIKEIREKYILGYKKHTEYMKKNIFIPSYTSNLTEYTILINELITATFKYDTLIFFNYKYINYNALNNKEKLNILLGEPTDDTIKKFLN